MKSIIVVSRGRVPELGVIGGELSRKIGAECVNFDDIDVFGLAKYDLICFGVEIGRFGADPKFKELIGNMSWNFNKKVAVFWYGSAWKKLYIKNLLVKLNKKQAVLIGVFQFKSFEEALINSFSRLIKIRQ